MDKGDIVYAERILEILKENTSLNSPNLYEVVHREYKGKSIKQHQNYDHILRELERPGFIGIEHLNKNVKRIYLLEKRPLGNQFYR